MNKIKQGKKQQMFLQQLSRIKTPKEELFFGAKGIKCDYDGDIIGETKLLLLGDITYQSTAIRQH
jgi:hypothetical protein